MKMKRKTRHVIRHGKKDLKLNKVLMVLKLKDQRTLVLKVDVI
nr:hypothetical protein [Clostridioides difficile]